jgi:hypothetical protein
MPHVPPYVRSVTQEGTTTAPTYVSLTKALPGPGTDLVQGAIPLIALKRGYILRYGIREPNVTPLRCGRDYDQKAWQRESFCGSCGEPLKTGLQRDRPQEIHPYPDRDPPPKLRFVINDLLDELGECARTHPFWFSAGALAAGVGGIMLGSRARDAGSGRDGYRLDFSGYRYAFRPVR